MICVFATVDIKYISRDITKQLSPFNVGACGVFHEVAGDQITRLNLIYVSPCENASAPS